MALFSPASYRPGGLIHSLWHSGLWRIFPFLLVYSIGLATIFPVTPSLVTNGWASIAAGHALDCQEFTPADAPKECRDAHSTAVTWSSWTSFIEGCVLSFIFSPFFGAASDRWGRKPFMLIGVGLQLVPVAVLLLFVKGLVPIWWYYPAGAVSGLVSSFSMCLTAVADLLEQRHRATAVGFLTSCFSVGIMIGPLLGGYMSTAATLWTCLGVTGITIAYVALFVQESAPLARERCGLASLSPRIYHGSHKESHASGVTSVVTAAADAGDSSQGDKEHEGRGSTQPLLHAQQAPAGPEDSAGPYAAHISGDGAADEGKGAEPATPAWRALAGDVAAEVAVVPERLAATLPLPGSVLAGGVLPGGVDMRGQQEAGADDDATHVHGSKAAASSSSSSSSRPGSSGANVPQRLSASGMGGGGGGVGARLSATWRLLAGSRFYALLALLWVVVSVALSGAQGLLMQYLQLTLGFNTRDQAHLLVVLAAGGLVVKLGMLPSLVMYLGEAGVLILGLIAFVGEDLMLAHAPTKAFALTAVTLGSLSSVTYPALFALQTSRAAPNQQGAVAGALQGVSSLASGLGPLGFAALFSAFTRSTSTLPYAPWVVWYAAAALTVVGVAVAAFLPYAGNDSTSHGDGSASTTSAAGGDVEAARGQEAGAGAGRKWQSPFARVSTVAGAGAPAATRQPSGLRMTVLTAMRSFSTRLQTGRSSSSSSSMRLAGSSHGARRSGSWSWPAWASGGAAARGGGGSGAAGGGAVAAGGGDRHGDTSEPLLAGEQGQGGGHSSTAVLGAENI